MAEHTHYLLLAEDWDAAAPVSTGGSFAALAAALQLSGEALTALVGAALDSAATHDAPVARFPAVNAAGEVAQLVAVRFPAAHRGPGAPTSAERFREAGLLLGAAGRAGVIWWDAPEQGADAARDELWAGVLLGSQRPATALAVDRASRFADGGSPSERARARVVAIAWVRELVERPANVLGPTEFAAEVCRFTAEVGRSITAETWTADELRTRGFGALLAVGGGSAREPIAVRLRWAASDAQPEHLLGVVGKGVTFDSGGANIKSNADELAWMKSDMAAAATVAAALVLASQQAEPAAAGVEVILPICDNSVSGAAMRPGDVVIHPGGRSTEVVDTDCEGRLILADGIGWFRAQGVAALLDAGTLTDGGAGNRVAGLWSNEASLAAALGELAREAADPLWVLPLPYGEEEILESRVADARNAPMDRDDLSRHAALYLAAAAGETPWAHLDLGGVAYLESPLAGWPEGATGAATVTLSEAMVAWAAGRLQ